MLRRVVALVSAGLLVVAATGTVAAHPAPAFTARASVQPAVQYLNDSTGTVFTFTIHDTGDVGIGAVEIDRPWDDWKVVACPTAPAGWSTQRTDSRCRYTSAATTADDIPGHGTSGAFQLKARVGPGSKNLSGTWLVIVSSTNRFDSISRLRIATPELPGLTTTAYAFQILDAVVVGVAPAPGSPCPAATPANHSAGTGAMGQIIAICGKNRANLASTPIAAQVVLGGTFIASAGKFSSGSIGANSASSIVLGSWSNVTITGTSGPNKTILAKVGSASNRTSPLTTLTGYTALDRPPVAQAGSASTSEDTASAPIGLSATDPDGDAMTFAISTGPTHGTLDPIVAAPCVSTAPAPSICAATVVYHPAADYNGPDSFAYIATDSFGAASLPASISLIVSSVNDPPVAVADPYSTDEDTVLSATSVLAKDSDLHGGAPNENNTPLAAVLVTLPTHAFAFTFNADGTFSYTPTADYNGADSFTYEAHDSLGASSAATLVSITIDSVNDAPVAVDDPGYATDFETPLAGSSVLTNDSDLHGGAPGENNTPLTAVLGSGPSHAATFALHTDGTFDYTPALGFDGADTFTYRAQDDLLGQSAPATATITVQPADDAPSVTSTSPADGDSNIALGANLTVTFSEPVDVVVPWFSMLCTVSGSHAATTSGGPSTFTLDPTADLALGDSCTVTVLAAQVTDQDAIDPPDAMASDSVFTFTAITDAAPSVVSTTPTNGQLSVAPSGDITVNFSEPVNYSVGSFTLECPSGTPWAFSLTTTSPGASATLDPTADLPAEATCKVTVHASGIDDVDPADPPDNMAADYVFSFTVAPDAVDDTYPQTVIGNVSIDSAGIPYSALTNDAFTSPVTVTTFDAASLHGGTVAMTTSGPDIGKFTYDPPAGYEGPDSFTYTISNLAGSDTATVSLTVSGMVWFINNAAVPGDGRLSSPFNTLAAFTVVNNGAGNHPAPSDNVFVYESATTYTSGTTLLSGQRLIGQDSTVSLASITGLTPPSGSAPFPTMNVGAPATTITNTAGIGIVLGGGNAIRGLTVKDTGSHGIAGTSVSGPTVTEVQILGAGDGDGESSIDLTNVSGTTLIADSLLSGATEDHVVLRNTNTNATLEIDDSTLSALDGPFGNSAVEIAPNGTSTLTVNIHDSTFSDIKNTAVTFGAQTLGSNNSSTLTFDANTITQTSPGHGGSVFVSGQESTTTVATITNNSWLNGVGGNGLVNFDTNDSSKVLGTVTDNTVASAPAAAFVAAVDDAGTLRVRYDNNAVTNSGGDGFQIVNFGGAGLSTLSAIVTNNTVNGNSQDPAQAFTGGIGVYAFEDTNCAAVSGNVVTGTPLGFFDILLDGTGATSFLYEENPNTGATGPTPAAYVISKNPSAPTVSVAASTLSDGTLCTAP